MDAETLARGYTLPAAWSSDANILRLESERIFRRSWQYAGRLDQVSEVGDFFTYHAGAIPIIVTRDREEVLRAFVNVCRHRGSEIVQERSGRRATIQCHYHAWTYDLDGSLRAAPRSEREPGFDKSEFPLLPVSVDTWGPLIFINPDPDARPLGDALGELPATLAGGGLDIDTLRFHHRAEFEVGANWKVACENFLECYHCPVAHPGFSAVIDVSPDAYRLEIGETFLSQYASPRGASEDGYDPRGEIESGQFHLLWPNTVVNTAPGRPNLSVGPIVPAGPARTTRFLDYFFGEDVDEAWIEGLVAFDDQVGREDKTLVESVQRGLGSGMVERGRLLLTSEHLIHDFQRRIAEALAAA